MQGRIFDIQRFSLHDGPGIRTTVFLKGCPLRCRWCHNPEGISPDFSVRFRSALCTGCGECLMRCDCHQRDAAGAHQIDRDCCTLCGSCVEGCPSGALSICGWEQSAEEAVKEIRRDKAFYTAGGGATFSGGEPLLQAAFVAEAARLLKQEGISVAVDTCGMVPWSAFEAVLPHVDLFLFDVKAVRSSLHWEGTGMPNEQILDNLFRLDRCGTDIWLRIPVIPGFNQSLEEMARISEIAAGLSQLKKVTLIPYHTLGKKKYAELGLSSPLATSTAPLAEEALTPYLALFQSKGLPAGK